MFTNIGHSFEAFAKDFKFKWKTILSIGLNITLGILIHCFSNTKENWVRNPYQSEK